MRRISPCRLGLLLLFCLVVVAPSADAEDPAQKPNPWAPVRFLAGEWTGIAEGQGGRGTATRRKLVFDSERFENFDNSWKARETYEIRSPDEFVETFELGAPGKPLEVYSRSTFRRVKPKA